VRRSPSARALRYFVALGSGFMLAAALLEMVPEGLHVNPKWAPMLICWATAAFTCWSILWCRTSTLAKRRTTMSLCRRRPATPYCSAGDAHFFDGIAIGSGFVLSSWLGWVIFIAVFLHKIPRASLASVMLASGVAAALR